jgi:hypothetical protein
MSANPLAFPSRAIRVHTQRHEKYQRSCHSDIHFGLHLEEPSTDEMELSMCWHFVIVRSQVITSHKLQNGW